MLHRAEFVKTHAEIRPGMTAFSATGDRLGVIERISDDDITIEKGRIFHKNVHVPYDNIAEVHEDDVIIREGREDFTEGRRERIEEPVATEETVTTEERVEPRTEAPAPEEKSEVKLEEPVETEKTPTGERMRSRPEARAPEAEYRPEEETWEYAHGREGKEARIPVREEELEAKKHEKEGEVRVAKEGHEEIEDVSGEVRKEKVRVDRTEPARKK